MLLSETIQKLQAAQPTINEQPGITNEQKLNLANLITRLQELRAETGDTPVEISEVN